MDKIEVLVLTKEDWKSIYSIPSYISLVCNEELEEMKRNLYDVVFVDRRLTNAEYDILQKKSSKAYSVFVTEKVVQSRKIDFLIESRKGKRITTSDIQAFFDNDIKYFFSKPYGGKRKVEQIEILRNFNGKIEWKGGDYVTLNGDFGEYFQQIAYWKYNIPVSKDKGLDLVLEYHKYGNVEIEMEVALYRISTIDNLLKRWTFSEKQIEEGIVVLNEIADGNLFVSLRAKGEGEVRINGLHVRRTRLEYGKFLPGGEVYKTSDGEEVFVYFEPGDMKPPLNVYFSGYKTLEGFEGYYLMKNMGCPFLLIAEARLEGGAFYIGSEEYEQKVVDVINKYANELGFSNSEIIMSGLSMGSTGALYYSVDIKPHAVIVGKPLMNIGSVAEKERCFRPKAFPTSIDVLLKNTGETDSQAIAALDAKMWNKMEKGNLSDTKFIISYMIEDDYDSSAYEDLVNHTSMTGVQIYGKGLHGRHNDDTNGIVYWFSSRFKSVISEDFNRVIE